MSTNSSNSKEHSKVKRCLMKFLMSSRSHNSWRVIRRKIDCLQPGTVVDYKYYLHGLLVVSDEYLRVLYEGLPIFPRGMKGLILHRQKVDNSIQL
ncbi:hypothetical protein CMV_029257 [Castanea mollissima]|uniref:Uncharacterized protein n=1 Tax=Castanea mollissima TaxID=60419 RepID=A0A8J4QER7_9ROSI|nr:hypothetical protein CMV_029257 [Castanea mollissima]